MTLPYDVERCAGRLSSRFTGCGYAPMAECRDCLRRTSPGSDHSPNMPPPEFIDGVCPSRIAPHD